MKKICCGSGKDAGGGGVHVQGPAAGAVAVGVCADKETDSGRSRVYCAVIFWQVADGSTPKDPRGSRAREFDRRLGKRCVFGQQARGAWHAKIISSSAYHPKFNILLATEHKDLIRTSSLPRRKNTAVLIYRRIRRTLSLYFGPIYPSMARRICLTSFNKRFMGCRLRGWTPPDGAIIPAACCRQ